MSDQEVERFYQKLWLDFVSLQRGDAQAMAKEIQLLRAVLEDIRRLAFEPGDYWDLKIRSVLRSDTCLKPVEKSDE